MIRSASLLLTALMVLTTGACGKSSVGMTCDERSECEDGLQCLRQRRRNPPFKGDCEDGEKFCSLPCNSEQDCIGKLGKGHTCVGVNTSFSECAPGLCFEGRLIDCNETPDDPACSPACLMNPDPACR